MSRKKFCLSTNLPTIKGFCVRRSFGNEKRNLDFFSPSCGAVRDKYGERFYQDICHEKMQCSWITTGILFREAVELTYMRKA